MQDSISRSKEELPNSQVAVQQTHPESTAVEITDYLRGVDVIGETSILVTNQAQSFKWVGYGLKIHVPKEALPADLEECRLLIKVGLSGQFGLPQYTSLSSAIYWLDSQPRCKFSQPIKSGNPTQCEEHSYITFEFCPCKVLPDGPPLSI